MENEMFRILVVDDEFGMREGCRKILTSSGYAVETAEDGLAGLELFQKRGNFAVALIDLKMPRMGGLELIEKTLALDPDVVAIVITAYAAIETAVEATKRGAYGYIPKPFSPDELLLSIKHGLQKRVLSLEAKQLRQEREERLLEVAYERSQSSSIIDCMTDAVLVINRDKQVVLRNAAAARAIAAFAQVTPPCDLNVIQAPELEKILTETLSPGSPRSIVSLEMAFDKATYLVNASPVKNPEGETLGAVAVLRDISALKKLEAAKLTFVSMVAHEVKSPLAAIEGYLNVVLSGAAGVNPERDREMLERSVLRARTLRNLVADLLNLTAIQTGNFTLKRSPVELKPIIMEVVENYRKKAIEKKIDLTFSLPQADSGRQVLADKEAIAIVFGNLIDNAIKYTPEGGHVKVSLEPKGIFEQVIISDDGIGMTTAEQERVFEEFFRAKNKFTAKVPGTGLGLAIVKRIADLHHAKLSLTSASGQGTSVQISIPTGGKE